MKKLLCLILVLWTTIIISANQQGHFFMNVEENNISAKSMPDSVIQWMGLPDGQVSFQQYRDETDNLGIQHVSYKLYYGNTEVQNAALLVHAKNGKTISINGDFLGLAAYSLQIPKRISPQKAAQKVRKNAKDSDAQMKIIRTIKNGEEVFRYAYEVTAEDYSVLYYIDAETGEIIKKVPLVFDVQATAKTYYRGDKTIDVTEIGDAYYLIDAERNIITYNANCVSKDSLYLIPTQTYRDSLQQILLNEMDNWEPELQNDWNYIQWWCRNQIQTNWYMPRYMRDCIMGYSATTSFTGTYMSTVKINNIYDDSWSSLLDSKPDLYVVIKDNNGYVRYSGENYYIDDATLPATITVNTPLWGTNYTIEIWDYDPIGNNNLIETLSIHTYKAGTYNWDDDVSKGTLAVQAGGGNPMNDVHWAMENAYDFYKTKFNRNSYDNYGSPIYNFVNAQIELFGEDNNNAFANYVPMLYAIMVYGMGDGDFMNPVTELDVIGHEFSHLVTAFNGNGGLEYGRESGALNESFSDIMGASIAYYVDGTYDWLMAKNVMIHATNLRSMKDPHDSRDGEGKQPKYYGEQGYWVNPNDTAKDYGGVHTNSGVQNYWFYLLTEGGSGTNGIYNYNIIGIGIDKAVQIAYRNLIYYLTPEATFEDARNGSIQAAIDLYGKDSQEHQSVENAWHAVGVGSKYTATTSPITINAKMPSTWGTTISAWSWIDGSEGQWVTLEKDGEWYSYTTSANPLNIVFVNGTTWNGDKNQSVDISVTENTCIQLNSNGTNKCTYTVIDCPAEESQLSPGKYVIVANRDKDGDKNWYYMTSDLGTASTKRFQAINTNVENLNDIVMAELDDKYIWELVADGENWKLMNGSNYVTWTSGNSANLAATGKTLTCDVTVNAVQVHFNDGTAERYLAMNQTTGNDYFAFYTGTNQIRNLVFLPYEEKIVPPARDCKAVPYTETFASSQGEFTAQNVTLPSGFTSIWNWDAKYGMVAKAINGSTKYKSEAWLISPCIELPEGQKCVLTFSHAAKFFSNTDQMTLYLTTDYNTEAPGESYWEQLIIPTYPTGANWNWYESGEIDLSAYSGQGVNIAFRYTSTTSYAPQWEIKNFVVKPSTTTLTESVQQTQPSVTKVLRNGQLLILRDGKTYTVQGQEVR